MTVKRMTVKAYDNPKGVLYKRKVVTSGECSGRLHRLIKIYTDAKEAFHKPGNSRALITMKLSEPGFTGLNGLTGLKTINQEIEIFIDYI